MSIFTCGIKAITQRELIASATSEANECPFCVKMHSSAASISKEEFTTDIEKLRSNAEVPTKHLMEFASKLASNANQVGTNDIEELQKLGFSKAALEQTIYIVYSFCLINRVANALDFDIPSENSLRFSANILLTKGYRI